MRRTGSSLIVLIVLLVGALMVPALASSSLANTDTASGIAVVQAGNRCRTVNAGMDVTAGTKVAAVIVTDVTDVSLQRVVRRTGTDKLKVCLDGTTAGAVSVSWIAHNGNALAHKSHKHDTRYYTKAQTNTQIQATIAAQPWSVHIAPSDLETNRWDSGNGVAQDFWPAITFANGVNGIGMAFNDGLFSRVYYGFQLPASYQAGVDVIVEMDWLPVSGFGLPVLPCDSVWWANSPFVSRPDSAGFYAGTTWEIPRGFDTTATRLPATADLFNNDIVSRTYMTIDGANLQPGDMLNVALNRDGDETDDTCEGIMVTGLLVHEDE